MAVASIPSALKLVVRLVVAMVTAALTLSVGPAHAVRRAESRGALVGGGASLAVEAREPASAIVAVRQAPTVVVACGPSSGSTHHARTAGRIGGFPQRDDVLFLRVRGLVGLPGGHSADLVRWYDATAPPEPGLLAWFARRACSCRAGATHRVMARTRVAPTNNSHI